MKRIFSKRSGFTLVEIIIAFAIFAIMASMIVQILNLMVQRKVKNKAYEDKLSGQEQSFVAKKKNWEYTAATPEGDGTLVLDLKDTGDAPIPGVPTINYQLKNWDKDDDGNEIYTKDGINYFVGNIDYDVSFEGSDYEGDEDPEDEDEDEKNKGGSTQMSRFDTRLTGTKGINSIQINVAHTTGNEYQVTVIVDDSGVDASLKGHSQVTMFFAEAKSGGKAVKVVSVNEDKKGWNDLLEIKPCGTNGVNVHCLSDYFGGSTIIFNVELEKELGEIAFGSNGGESNTYNPFTVKDKDGNVTDTYVNIFGAYIKESSKGDTTDGDGDADSDEE